MNFYHIPFITSEALVSLFFNSESCLESPGGQFRHAHWVRSGYFRKWLVNLWKLLETNLIEFKQISKANMCCHASGIIVVIKQKTQGYVLIMTVL